MSDRLDVEFLSGNVVCRAWLYLPKQQSPSPIIVMGHGLGAIREMRLSAYAERFCAAGYACLVFDYRHFGASKGEPRQLLNIKRQLEDWAAAITYVRSLKEIDRNKLVLWGTSFGGGHVMVTASRDANIAAVIAQCPFTDGIASAMAANWISLPKVMMRCIWDMIGAKFGAAPVVLATVGEPGSTGLMTAPDCKSGYLGLVPNDMPFSNHVIARCVLKIARYRPGRLASKIKCPALFCICENDSVAPAKVTLRYAQKAPLGEIKFYREGHFDIYVGEAFERIVRDQLAFLNRQVTLN